MLEKWSSFPHEEHKEFKPMVFLKTSPFIFDALFFMFSNGDANAFLYLIVACDWKNVVGEDVGGNPHQ